MSEKLKENKIQIVQVFNDEQYEKAKKAGFKIVDRRMDSPAELKGESELVEIAGLNRDEKDSL